MRILVAGGCGYIGSVLCPLLAEKGHEVVVIDRMFFGRNLPADIEVRAKDIRAVEEVDFYGIDRVIDLAGLSNDPACDLDPTLTQSINFGGAVRMARLAHDAGVGQYTYASSCAVYGIYDESKPKPTEDAGPTNPLTEYARSKLNVENALRRIWGAAGRALTIYRFATVYGLSPRMRFDLAPNLMTLNAWRGKEIELWSQPTTWRPFVHVKDVARIVAEPPDRGPLTINVGSTDMTLQLRPLADRIAALQYTTIVEKPSDDRRSYRPSFERCHAFYSGQGGAWAARTKLEDGVKEILNALNAGLDFGERTRTIERYKTLIETSMLCTGGLF